MQNLVSQAPEQRLSKASWPDSVERLTRSIPEDQAHLPAPRLPRELTTEEQLWISARTRQLAAMVEATPDPRATAVSVAELYLAFPASGMSSAQAEAAAQVYMTALRDEPAWAVREVVSDVIAGRIPTLDRRFRPTAPELAELVRARRFTVKGEWWSLRRLELGSAATPTAPSVPYPRDIRTMEQRILRRDPATKEAAREARAATMFVLATSALWPELAARWKVEHGEEPCGDGWSFPTAWVQERLG